MALGHGVIDDSGQGKGPLDLSPLHRDSDGHLVKVGCDFRRHRREVNGCQSKGASVFVLRPRAILATGDCDGDRLRGIVEINCRSNSSAARTSTMESGLGRAAAPGHCQHAATSSPWLLRLWPPRLLLGLP